ncbi:D-glycerate dehydrogenase [Ammoniphilus sp. YIM 78166]|uniref:2-hydroxyacid dehydrogenase n=1 Tax=Ammoniphilus sp. YIM 78166 TaxID=1644106 RepID=UPI00106FE3DA|nr:D-glycerate dehydrogenase [Ammoniphilus sp. YIM 78166]
MSKPRIFVPNRVNEEVIHYLQQYGDVDYRDQEEKMAEEEFLVGLRNASALLCYSRQKINASILEQAPLLKVVSNIAVGYDNLDLGEMTKRGVLATNTPGILTETTADLTFSILMAAARRVAEADYYVKSGQWKEWFPSLMLGKDVFGATIGIIGMGRIGEAVARRAKGFDMNILYYNRSRKTDAEAKLGATFVSLEELLQRSDYVVVLTPLTAETQKFIGVKELALMKKDAILVNASRGATVDETALIHALQEKRIAGAALDVYEKEPVDPENPLLKMANVVTLPHIGSATRETRAKMAMKAARNAIAALQGEIPENLLNKEVL